VLYSTLLAAEVATITRVVDGDTIVVSISGRQEKVRLIGVDTPGTVHLNMPVEYFGKESAFARRMADGQQIRLGGGCTVREP
jgi:micrococcal nuclease